MTLKEQSQVNKIYKIKSLSANWSIRILLKKIYLSRAIKRCNVKVYLFIFKSEIIYFCLLDNYF